MIFLLSGLLGDNLPTSQTRDSHDLVLALVPGLSPLKSAAPRSQDDKKDKIGSDRKKEISMGTRSSKSKQLTMESHVDNIPMYRNVIPSQATSFPCLLQVNGPMMQSSDV